MENELGKRNTIKVFDEAGNEVVCDILFTFDNEETKKSYIAYTDNSKDSQGRVQIYASIYDPNDPEMKLEEIKTEKEWKVIDTILETLQEQLTSKPDNE